jgi:hypothetical protein
METLADKIAEVLIVRLCQTKIIGEAINQLAHDEWEGLEEELYHLANEVERDPDGADDIVEKLLSKL